MLFFQVLGKIRHIGGTVWARTAITRLVLHIAIVNKFRFYVIISNVPRERGKQLCQGEILPAKLYLEDENRCFVSKVCVWFICKELKNKKKLHRQARLLCTHSTSEQLCENELSISELYITTLFINEICYTDLLNNEDIWTKLHYIQPSFEFSI